MLFLVYHMGLQDIASGRTGFTNLVNIMARFSVDKVVARNKFRGNCRRQMLQPERESDIDEILLLNFSKPGDLVLGAFAVTILKYKCAYCWTRIEVFCDVEGTVISCKRRWQGLQKFILVSCKRTGLI